MTNFPRRMGLPEELEEIKRRLYEIERSIPESVAETSVTNGSYTGNAAALRIGNVVIVWSSNITRTSSNNTTLHVVISGLLPTGMRPAVSSRSGSGTVFNGTGQYRYVITGGSGDLEIQNTAGVAGTVMPFTMAFRIPEEE